MSVYRIGRDGGREAFADGIVNATSLAISPEGELFVSSRYDGTVYRVREDGHARGVRQRTGRAVRAGVCARRHALRRRSHRHHPPREPRRPAHRDLRHAPAERGGVPSGHRARRAALRHGTHAGHARRRAPLRRVGPARGASTTPSAGRRGSPSTRTACCTSSRRWPA